MEGEYTLMVAMRPLSVRLESLEPVVFALATVAVVVDGSPPADDTAG